VVPRLPLSLVPWSVLGSGEGGALDSFPTRRSSDLVGSGGGTLLPDVPNWLHQQPPFVSWYAPPHVRSSCATTMSLRTGRDHRGGVAPVSLHVCHHGEAESFQAVVFCSAAGYVCRRDRERPSVLCVPLWAP